MERLLYSVKYFTCRDFYTLIKKVFKAHCYSPQIAKKRRTSYIIFFLFLLIKIYLFIIPFLMEI